MLPPPPPCPYTPADLTRLCRQLSTALQPWSYHRGVVHSHWIGANSLAPRMTVHRHTHRFFEGFIVLRGSVDLITPWERQRLESGSILLLSPGTVHQWQTREPGCLMLVITCDLDHALVTPPRASWPVCPEILWTVWLLCETVDAAEEGWPLRAHGYLGAIYARLVSMIEQSAVKTPPPATPPQLVARVDELLLANLAAPITLDELAAHLAMSARHLTRLFRALTGSTVHARLDALRMERAAKLLCSTNLPIEEIARAVGITTAAYFARCFRRRFDTTPHAFRRRETTRGRHTS